MEFTFLEYWLGAIEHSLSRYLLFASTYEETTHGKIPPMTATNTPETEGLTWAKK